ncbi:MAG TPA: NUDIX hydrolase [Salinimicrobium sp.]|nr:NUDIX hydrolase [Salinimicrobium sp.]
MRNHDIGVTVDNVIFYQEKNNLFVLLVQRGVDPFKGMWCLPGGFLKSQETLEAGAKRELEEETGLKIEKLEQVKAFGKLDRDPRGRTISIAFWGKVDALTDVKGQDDAMNAEWFNIDKIPELAFDHKEIYQEAFKSFKNLKLS